MVVMEEAVVEGAAASEDVNLVELMNARARSYGMLARLFREEVDLPTLRELQKMRFPQATGNAAADEGYHQLYDYLKRAWDDSVTELAIDYVSTFIGHGVNGYSAAYPYESVYTSERRLLMQEARRRGFRRCRRGRGCRLPAHVLRLFGESPAELGSHAGRRYAHARPHLVLPGSGAADARLPAGGRNRPARAFGFRGSLSGLLRPKPY